MGTVVVAPKIGKGSSEDPIRPDTHAAAWQVVEEREDEFVIEILDE